MLQELAVKTNLAQIGEAVGIELGRQMVKNYRQTNPADVEWYMIGREIIEKILAQPNCVGIKFFNALNEFGQKTLVYVGIDQNGSSILRYSVIDISGELQCQEGIVADRIRVPTESETIIEDDNIFAE
jgi:hypothetical protein